MGDTKIKAGKFKGMYHKEMIEFQRSKKNKKKKAIDKQLSKDYSRWIPITDLRRSFFVWKGKWSASPKENEISNILKKERIRFHREVSFDMKKRFDFYIPLLDLVIEYDGSQHFKETGAINNDIFKEGILSKLGVKLIRYNKHHKLQEQIKHDLIHHPVLKNKNQCQPKQIVT